MKGTLRAVFVLIETTHMMISVRVSFVHYKNGAAFFTSEFECVFFFFSLPLEISGVCVILRKYMMDFM